MKVSPQPKLIFLNLLVPYTLGILFFDHFKFPQLLYLLLWTNSALLIVLFLINGYYLRSGAYHFKSWIGVLIYLFLFFLGGIFCRQHQSDFNQDHFSRLQANYLKVMVIDEPQQKTGILRFRGEIQTAYQGASDHTKLGSSSSASGKMMISIQLDPSVPLPLLYGDELLIPAKYSPISRRFHLEEFDYQGWLAKQNIHHQSFFLQHQILKLRPNSGNQFLSFTIALRARQVHRYEKLLKDKESVALASTLILGYRAELSKEILDTYSKTGTIHALSVSGMHVGLIYLILNHCLAFLNRGKVLKMVKLMIILTLLWFYAFLTGCSPSVLRSVIMISVFLIGQTYSRQANSYNIFSFTAFFMLLYDPFFIWDVGFQLSFLAVLGLIYLQPKLQDCWRIKNKWAHKLWGVVAMSLAAQLFTFPLSIYYFHQFPVYFLLSNLFILLPISLLMYLGILVLIPGFDFLAPAVSWLIQFTNHGLQYIEKIPYASVTGIWINRSELWLLSLSLTLLTLALVQLNKKHLICAFVFFLALQTSLSWGAIMSAQQEQVIHFTIARQPSIAYLFAHEAIIYTQLKQQDPAFRYFIQPVLDHHKIRSLKIITAPP